MWNIFYSVTQTAETDCMYFCEVMSSALFCKRRPMMAISPKAEHYWCLRVNTAIHLVFFVMSTGIWEKKKKNCSSLGGLKLQSRPPEGVLPVVVKHLRVMSRDKQNGVCCWAKVGRGEATARGMPGLHAIFVSPGCSSTQSYSQSY